jgi:hypothetical protein
MSSWRPVLNQSMYTLVSMIRRRMSREELLEPSHTCGTLERGVDLGFRHDERQLGPELLD